MIGRELSRKATAFGVAIILAAGVMTGCKGRTAHNNEEQESTTATNIMTVTIKDKDGKDVVLEGVGVSDAWGKTTITVTDKDGNELVVSGDTSLDDNGNVIVKQPVIVSGNSITTKDGTTVDITDATVGDVSNNDDGTIDTDVAVSDEQREDTKKKQEEATAATSNSTENHSSAPETTTEVPAKQTTESGSEPSSVDTQEPTSEPMTESTQEPTQEPTEAETEAPTEAPTQGKKIQAINFFYVGDPIDTAFYDYYTGTISAEECKARMYVVTGRLATRYVDGTETYVPAYVSFVDVFQKEFDSMDSMKSFRNNYFSQSSHSSSYRLDKHTDGSVTAWFYRLVASPTV